MRVLALLAVLFLSAAYASEGYGTEAEAPAPPPPAPEEEGPAPDEDMAETADKMEAMEEAEPAEDSYAAEEPAPPAPAPEEPEAPATDAPAPEEEAEEAPATDAPAPAPAAEEEGYGPPPEMPEAPEEPEATEAPEETEEAPEEAPAPEEPAPMEESGYRRRRVLKMSEIRLADIHLKFNMNCMDHHEFCEFWASIKKGTVHPLTGLFVERSECFRNRRLVDFDGCPKSCGVCTNNLAEWSLRRRLASRKLAFLRRSRKILL